MRTRLREQELLDRLDSPDDEAAQASLENATLEQDPEPFDYAEHFWLKKPYFSDEYASDVSERYGRHIDFWNESSVGRTIWAAYRSYHNLEGADGDPITQLSATGEVGELLAMAIPHYRTLVRHQIALFTENRPAWDPQARTADAQSARQVPLAGNLLDYVMSLGGLDQRLIEQVELMMVAGAGYFVTGWDEQAGLGGRGWFTQRVYAPWEVVHERVRTYEDASWHIFRTFESRWDWVARFASADPEKAERIAGLDPKHSDFMTSFMDHDRALYEEDADRLPVLIVIARPTLACPEGRLSIIAGEDLVLADGPYPYGEEVTISRMCASEFLGTSQPYCDSWGTLAGAEAMNAILGMILTRIDVGGVPNYATTEGTEIEFSDIASGNAVWKLPPGAADPKVIDLLQIPSALPEVMALIGGMLEETVGVNSVTKGKPQENVSSGSMAALLQSMAIQFASNLERAWILNLERIGTHHLRVFQMMATEEHAISVMGADHRWTVQSFRGEDIRGVMRVSVKTASALSKTTAGRAEIANKLLEMKLIRSPQEYLKVVQTGQLEPLFAGPVGELNTIKSRGERLLRGERAPALVWDNHELCVREFKALLNTEARDQPQIAQAIMDAIQEHFQLWTQLSQQSPDMLAAIGCPPLPQALQIGQQAQAMQMQGMMPGAPPGAPAQHGPPPQQVNQPETEPGKGRPGPAPRPPGAEPSQANPSQPKEPKPARSPLDGQSVV